ncbi:MAG: HAD-IA family hydrolase [Clostridia bacterium]
MRRISCQELHQIPFRLHHAAAGDKITMPNGHNQLLYLSDNPAALMWQPLRRGFLRHWKGLCCHQPCRWISEEAIFAACQPYQVISFDVFDTLLYREVERPVDVFLLLEVQRRQMDFAQLRVKAEKDARSRYGGEVTLRQIYEHMAWQGIVADVDEAVAAELDMELRIVRPSSRMLAVVQKLLAQGKRVVAISDMYLPAEAIRKLLANAGFPVPEQIFVSCEQGMGKANGAIFKRACEALGTTSVLHIGDNFEADVMGACRAGIDAAYGINPHRPQQLQAVHSPSTTASSIYRSLVDQRLNAGRDIPDAAYGVGYTVTGFLLYGFCQWVHQQQKLHGWDKVFFCGA